MRNVETVIGNVTFNTKKRYLIIRVVDRRESPQRDSYRDPLVVSKRFSDKITRADGWSASVGVKFGYEVWDLSTEAPTLVNSVYQRRIGESWNFDKTPFKITI